MPIELSLVDDAETTAINTPAAADDDDDDDDGNCDEDVPAKRQRTDAAVPQYHTATEHEAADKVRPNCPRIPHTEPPSTIGAVYIFIRHTHCSTAQRKE